MDLKGKKTPKNKSIKTTYCDTNGGFVAEFCGGWNPLCHQILENVRLEVEIAASEASFQGNWNQHCRTNVMAPFHKPMDWLAPAQGVIWSVVLRQQLTVMTRVGNWILKLSRQIYKKAFKNQEWIFKIADINQHTWVPQSVLQKWRFSYVYIYIWFNWNAHVWFLCCDAVCVIQWLETVNEKKGNHYRKRLSPSLPFSVSHKTSANALRSLHLPWKHGNKHRVPQSITV